MSNCVTGSSKVKGNLMYMFITETNFYTWYSCMTGLEKTVYVKVCQCPVFKWQILCFKVTITSCKEMLCQHWKAGLICVYFFLLFSSYWDESTACFISSFFFPLSNQFLMTETGCVTKWVWLRKVLLQRGLRHGNYYSDVQQPYPSMKK